MAPEATALSPELRGRGVKNCWQKPTAALLPGVVFLFRRCRQRRDARVPGPACEGRAGESLDARLAGRQAASVSGCRRLCRLSAIELIMSAKPGRLRCWRAWPRLWTRVSQSESLRPRFIDSASLRRGLSRAKSVSVGDGSQVLGAVQSPGTVVRVAVEPDGDGCGVVVVGEPVVVAPAEFAVLVGVAMRADALECRKQRFPDSSSSPMPRAPPWAESRTARREPSARRTVLSFEVDAFRCVGLCLGAGCRWRRRP
jgi:hypothetical protein